MAKRKHSTAAAPAQGTESAHPAIARSHRRAVPLPAPVATHDPKPPRRQPSYAGNSVNANPNANPDILDGRSALRASPDGTEEHQPVVTRDRRAGRAGTKAEAGQGASAAATTEDSAASLGQHGVNGGTGLEGSAAKTPTVTNTRPLVSETIAGDLPSLPGRKKRRQAAQHVKVDSADINKLSVNSPAQHVTCSTEATIKVEDVGAEEDPEVDTVTKDEVEEEGEIKEALSRPPPVNSDYLPLPWKGRLGYACLNTYLRSANPPVFSSRTCRIASILEHRHPLKDPSQPEHPTKNRPDKAQPADVSRGQKYVEEIGLANARDIIKMVRWNDKYGIKFMRLSSEMFPFASHDVYGYKLAPFASEILAEAGKVIASLGHRVTTHPGQFTQLGSPRKEVIDASIRDLNFHDEMLSLLKLPPQQDRDAVMILHLGGAYGDKEAALARFRQNYAKLSQSVKNRLVLENDDVVWSVHELLPLCQELNIPMVLDFHHHNIVFDSSKIREGTKDIVELFPQIIETWTKKNITPKMHYSESCPDATTARSRRKHSPRVATLPPCPDTMDLMIEAKDKEQAVFELMRTFKLPGFNLFNEIIPHTREDENKPWKPTQKKVAKKGKKKAADNLDDLDARIEDAVNEEKPPPLIPEEELGMGGPESRVYWPPGMEDWLRPPKRIIKKKEEGAETSTPAKKKRKTVTAVPGAAAGHEAAVDGDIDGGVKPPAKKKPAPNKSTASDTRKSAKTAPTPSASDDEGDSSSLSGLGSVDDEALLPKKTRKPPKPTRQKSGRASRVSYKEEDVDE